MGRPKGILATAEEKAAGYGKTGFCSICVWPGSQFLNKNRLAKGEEFNYTKAKDLAGLMDPDYRFPNRRVWYTHTREHLHSPLVTAVERARREARDLPKTNREGLELIRDLGLEAAINNPDLVTPDHAIKAMDVMEKKTPGPQSVLMLLAQVQAGRPPEIVQGEYFELETQEEEVQPA